MKVLLAMSGGVDSSVAGALLLDAGHDVVGITMRLWGGESDAGCCSVADVDDARRVAQQLGIDHLVFNFSEDFTAQVVTPYVEAHAAGRTPNPCIECNRHLKFARLTERADALGFDAVATGHHARIVRRDDGSWSLRRGVDLAKDQSYVVHMLGQQVLARTLFPVGHLTKDDVRRRALTLGLRTAAKPDSQDVCFITATGRRDFLARRIPLHAAEVRDGTGAALGTVDAVELVTLGQRRGLPLAGAPERRYVVAVDVPGRAVTIGHEHDLLVGSLRVRDVTWTGSPVVGDVLVQTSAHGVAKPARLGAGGVVTWANPERAVAPGQSVVFYDPSDSEVLGGGIAV